MNRPAVTYPDLERAMVDLVQQLVAAHEPEATVGVGVPTGWAPGSPVHVQIRLDSPISLVDHPVVARGQVACVVRAATTTDAKRIAGLLAGLLDAYSGDAVVSARPSLGAFPGRDPDTRAELASITVQVTVRSTPIT